jgi:hypothetical protein
MTLDQIKSAVKYGLTVNWHHRMYVVVADSGASSGLSAVYDRGGPGENRVGLTQQDGTTLTEIGGFYVPAACLSYAVDDALSERSLVEAEKAEHVRYVGFQAGFEILWVAVWSYLATPLDDEEACELAIDLLLEKKWFADEGQTEPTVVI